MSATLTRREQIIVAFAAQGMLNREIAERLFLSIRTVENHLQRSYTKLGIHSRHELRAARRAAEVCGSSEAVWR
ncbi:response regulator transcription factor [Nocardia sp. NPDC020380]|uniref:response regulator transcription factor n=1 Tax=Nocardia sp. NPDC020380 TaxID=3364309 RepID=UPI00378CCEF4